MPGRLWLTLGLLAACVAAAAQDFRTITGTIRDSSGGPLAGATVAVHSAAGVELASVESSDAGMFRLPGLTPGVYSLQVQKAGFARAPHVQVTVDGSHDAVADFTLMKATLKFEASGVRGLIDPGGYSVPAQSAAATKMISSLHSMEQDTKNGQHATGCGSGEQLSSLVAGTGPNVKPDESQLFSVAYKLIFSGDANGAVAAFDEGLKLRPGSARLWAGRGAAQFLAGRAAEAVSSYLHAIALDKSNLQYYRGLTDAFEASGVEAPLVEQTLKQFAEKSPQSGSASYLYAICLLKAGDPETSAEALLQQAIRLDPGMAEAHFQLAAILSRVGNDGSAIREYEKALQLGANEADIHYRLAALYRRAGKADQAAAHLRSFQDLRARERQEASASKSDVLKLIAAFDASCPALSR